MNDYDRAIATWIGRHENIDPAAVTLVEFVGMSGCNTCGYGEGAAISYFANGRSGHVDLDEPGTFVAECVQILGESA